MTQASTGCVVTGPVTGGDRGWPFAASMLDIKALGYEEHEYFLSGDATRYRQVDGTPWGRDGRWQVEPAGTAAYKTRILVYRPADARRFNGTVIVTWNNVTAGYELFGADSLEIIEGGYALVCASVQRVGIEGLPPVRQGLAAWDPGRYGTLSIPGDDYSFDIFTQIGRAVGPERNRAGCDPLAGLAVQRVVAQGASQSAGRLATYVNAIAPLASAFCTSASACSGKVMSACRNSSTSPLAVLAPAFICRARPRGLASKRSHSGAASAAVASRLPPSTTITSCPRSRSGASACSAAAMPAASSSTGTMIDKRITPSRGQAITPARHRNCCPGPRCSRSNAAPRGWRHLQRCG